jgi:flagellar hook-associated protein 2
MATSSTSSATFQASGLASGLDWQSITDSLVKIRQIPIDTNNTRQAALNVQISSIGDLISKVKSFSSAGSDLSTNGVVQNTVSASPTGVSATTGPGTAPGRYAVTVSTLATAAKARSGAYNTPDDKISGGTLSLSVKGVAYNINIAANTAIGDVAKAINASGAPVSAGLISDGSKYYLSLTNKDTGKPIGSAANGGLQITDNSGIGLAVTQDATNATFSVDGLPMESQSNTVTTAIPGVTLNFSQANAAGDLVIAQDSGKTQAKLQAFADAYNAIAKVLTTSLRPDPNSTSTNPDTQIDGSLALNMRSQMQGLFSKTVSTTGTVRTLADLGFKQAADGTVSLDSVQMNKALAADPTAVEKIFSDSTNGIAKTLSSFSTQYTDSFSGVLVSRRTSLQTTIKNLATANTQLQAQVDAYRNQLTAQFSQMEDLISGYKNISSYITNSGLGVDLSKDSNK